MTTTVVRVEIVIEPVRHEALIRSDDVASLARLFDAEYLADFGPWHPAQPYGYAPHDVHVIARAGAVVLGHAGWGRRRISVGGGEVVIAGVGGVLVAGSARGQRLGEKLMAALARSMAGDGGIEFGYLGCREEVVPFYEACGWTRVTAAERSISRDGMPIEDPPGQPLLILPVVSPLDAWPVGVIDLRGRAW
ncbi:GNAT family N-acetyltransferase [Microbacterium stercoris]|uniref:GNAT family N-acetyltransferase n=1 Tax=Microbacterium stercoris TaxID=2820289 RepID=UPI0027DBD48E|nr:GNAT family N-acetyltransferase [Microbacterium stercoris]